MKLFRPLLACVALSVFAPSVAHAEPRFRWEVGAAGGPLAHDGGVGGIAGLHLQLGIQLGSILALYYQGMFGGGAGVGNGGYVQYNSVVAEATLFNHFQVGVGPSIDIIRTGFGSPSSTADSSYRSYLGAVGRVGLAIGGSNGHVRRGGLLLGLEVHPTFAPTEGVFMAPTAILFTIGGGQY